jgi:hypothetical protein
MKTLKEIFISTLIATFICSLFSALVYWLQYYRAGYDFPVPLQIIGYIFVASMITIFIPLFSYNFIENKLKNKKGKK